MILRHTHTLCPLVHLGGLTKNEENQVDPAQTDVHSSLEAWSAGQQRMETLPHHWVQTPALWLTMPFTAAFERGCVFLLKDALGTVSHTPMPRSSLTHFSARPQLGGTVLDSSLPRLKGASFSKIGGTADSYPVVRHATIISPLWSRIRAEPLAGQLMVVKVSMLWTRC